MSAHHIAPFRFGILLLISITAATGMIAGCASAAPGAAATSTPRPIALDPALAGDTVYITTSIGTGVSLDGYLLALNAETGKLRWSSHAAGTIGVPVVGQGTVYMAASDGKVYAFATDTGKLRWQFQRTTGVGTNTGFDGYPTLAGQTLYVDSDGGAVYALDAASGKLRWLFTVPTAGDHIYTAPAIAGDILYVSSGVGLYALDAASGKLRWKFEPGDGLDGVPRVVDGVVYVGGRGFYTMYALRASSGIAIWKFQASQSIISPPAVGNGMLYAGSTDQTVYALSTTNGQLAWKFSTKGGASTPLLPTGCAPTLAGNALYVGGQGGGVYALDPVSGKVLWSRSIDSAVDSAPAVVDGTVFVASDQGSVYAVRADDGSPGWVYHAGGGALIYASPVVAPLSQ
jgi:outer membrane protein assembly factor BamB